VGAARPDPEVPPWARSPRPVTRPHPPPRPRRGSVHRGRACAAPAAAGRAVRPRHARTAPLLTTREGDERDVAEVERLGPEAPRLEAVQGRAVATSAGVGGPVVLGSRVLVGMPHRETLARPCRSARAPGGGDARRRAGVVDLAAVPGGLATSGRRPRERERTGGRAGGRGSRARTGPGAVYL